jgi:hypothetical protein
MCCESSVASKNVSERRFVLDNGESASKNSDEDRLEARSVQNRPDVSDGKLLNLQDRIFRKA